MSAPKMGGFKMSLGGSKPKPGAKLNGPPPAKKPRLVLDEEETEDKNKTVEITGFDTAGAIDVNRKEAEAPRIIASLPNRNWGKEVQASVRRQQQGKTEDNAEALEESKLAYGLTVVKKEGQNGESTVKAEEVQVKLEPADDGLTEEQRLEKRAIEAVLNGKATDETVIPAQNGDTAHDEDYTNAPDAPSLDAYAATPIDGFGAALLRGMGWKDGEEIGRNKENGVKPREIKRRPALLGIGAKEEAATGIELGTWNQKKGRGMNQAQEYAPIAMRNKKTGEIITEEELKKKLASQDMVPEDVEEESRPEKKYGSDDSEERSMVRSERKRDRRREDEYDSERRRDRRRDDDYDSKRRSEKRRDDDYDSERRREKRRDDDYDSERRREKRRERDHRELSRTRDSDDKRRREKRRDERRYRSRSRDSNKRRRDYDEDRDDRKRRHRDERYRD
jgi:hypothetical protein